LANKLTTLGLVLGWGLLANVSWAQGPAGSLPPRARLGEPVAQEEPVGTTEAIAAPGRISSLPPLLVSQAPPVAEPPRESTEPAPAGMEMAPKEGDGDGQKKEKSFWETNPPVRPLPPPGLFIPPPKGEGYYSLWDVITDHERKAPPPFPYSRTGAMFNSFFDADFRYLDDPKNEYHDPIFDCLHRIHCGDCWLFSVGGEERLRLMDAQNDRLSGQNNRYMLERTRVYGDLWYSNLFRAYVEFIDARSTHQHLNPLAIDQDHGDLLNAFVDVNFLGMEKYPVYARIGRQEMLLGSERLVSPLDWANTRRTFQGISVFRNGKDFDFTAFAVQPVGIPNNTNAGVTNPRWNSVNDRENFYGVFTTYRPEKGQYIDLYWFDYNNANSNASSQGPSTTEAAQFRTGAFNVYTVGSRLAGDVNHFLYDFEGMYQWGDWAGNTQEISAAAYTTALGYNYACSSLNPTFWLSWDWASGNHNPNGNEHGTFNQLFPFNHYYFGQMDLIGRQNIEDLNCQVSVWPAKWWLVNFQWHYLWLESAQDALYSPSGAVLRNPLPGGASGRFVGNMFTVTTNFHIDAHQDILVGYSNLLPGGFIKDTGTGESPRPQLFYVQYTLRF
jgi:hypothetical protein